MIDASNQAPLYGANTKLQWGRDQLPDHGALWWRPDTGSCRRSYLGTVLGPILRRLIS